MDRYCMVARKWAGKFVGLLFVFVNTYSTRSIIITINIMYLLRLERYCCACPCNNNNNHNNNNNSRYKDRLWSTFSGGATLYVRFDALYTVPLALLPCIGRRNTLYIYLNYAISATSYNFSMFCCVRVFERVLCVW